MEKYQPPYTITNQMLSYVASISEKIGRITLISNMESLILGRIIELSPFILL